MALPMRAGKFVLVLFGLCLVPPLGGCGGSGSETPWPAEPRDVELDPDGERDRDEALTRPSSSGNPRDESPARETPKPSPIEP